MDLLPGLMPADPDVLVRGVLSRALGHRNAQGKPAVGRMDQTPVTVGLLRKVFLLFQQDFTLPALQVGPKPAYRLQITQWENCFLYHCGKNREKSGCIASPTTLHFLFYTVFPYYPSLFFICCPTCSVSCCIMW